MGELQTELFPRSIWVISLLRAVRAKVEGDGSGFGTSGNRQ
jgi:hypothetical protein